MTDDPRFVPTELRAPRGANYVEIDWADDHASVYSNEWLRGYCPCAGCQGHNPEISFVPDGNSTIDEIEEVGSYGLSFRWGDGHETGIYTFKYLRSLCACPFCIPPERAGERPTRQRL